MYFVLLELLIYAAFSADLESFHSSKKLSNTLSRKRMLTKCPPEPLISKESVILSPKSDTMFLNQAVYGCHQAFLSNEFKFTNCILRVYGCNFTNSNSDKNAIYFSSSAVLTQLEGDIEINGCQFFKYHSKVGGSIYIFSSDSSRTVSISNCYFAPDNTMQSEKGGALFINAPLVIIKNTQFINCHSVNGGCIYYTNENNNQVASDQFTLKIKRCIFKNSEANSNGGSLYLSTQLGNIEVKGCKFTNNHAENGCDISYNFGLERSNKGGKLTITDNVFTRNSKLIIKRNVQESLIYASFNPNSQIEFTNNRVSVDQSFNKVFLFDYPEGTSILNGQLKIENNDMQPSFANQIDRKKVISSMFDSSKAKLLEDITCNKPDGFTDNDFYACNQRILEHVKPEGQLLIEYCNFSNFKNDFVVTVQGYTGEGNINIKTCNFVYCLSGAISISNASPKELKITGCCFILCTIRDDDKGVITFTSKRGIIEKCQFYYNNNDDLSSTVVIYYRNPPNDPLVPDDKLVIRECFFEYNNENKGTIFLKLTPASIFDFIDNTIQIYNPETRIFGSTTTKFYFNNCLIQKNTLWDYNEKLIGTTVPDGAFTNPPDSKCFALPDGVEETENNWQCFAISDQSEDTYMKSNTIVSIFYSSFTSNGESDANDGGAVYISLPENLDIDSSVPLRIYYSSFISCYAQRGSAIFAESFQSSRLFDIHRCTFMTNTNFETESGGGVYVKSSTSTFKFSRCIFQGNKAIDGGGIYYTSEGTSSSKNLLETEEDETKYGLKVIDCVFQLNKAFDNGGAICIIDNVESKPVEINSCIFLGNTAVDADTAKERGGAISYSFSKSSQTSDSSSGDDNRLFYVFNSVFEENMANDYGSSICISVTGNEPSKTIEIASCTFKRNYVKSGYGGDICYVLSKSTKLSSENSNPSLSIHDCQSLNSVASLEGGSICIIIEDSESSRPIEIKECSINCDGQSASKGEINKNGISISYTISSTTGTHSNNPPLNINDCNFSCTYSGNKQTEKGGLIYLSVKNIQQSGSIEIKNCKFTSKMIHNNNNVLGGAIYYSYEQPSSSSSSTTTPSILKITECEFTETYSKSKGSSLYLSVTSDTEKQIDISGCTFNKFESENNQDNAYIESGSKKVQFNIINCDFKGHPIYFNALSTKIENSRFDDYDDGKSSIRYLSNYNDPTTECSLSINKCNFTQSENENIKNNAVSSVYFEKSLSSKFSFTNNIIKFSNENSHVLDRGEIEVKSNDYWNFRNNEIEPNEYKTIKTEKADDIPATCGTEFFCPIPPEPLDESCTAKPEDFKDDVDFYACNLIIKTSVTTKGQLIVDQCNFTNFKGGYAISVNGYPTTGEGSIIIKRCNFVYCQNGAIDMNEASPNELKITRCYFIFCKTSDTKSGIISFKSKRGIIDNCNFYYNNGISSQYVISYINPSPESTDPKDKLTIHNCFFEYSNTEDQSTVYLSFTSVSKFDFLYNKIMIYNSAAQIFKCTGGSVDISEYSIHNNILSDFDQNLIGKGIKVPNNAFIKAQNSECPALPDGVQQTENNRQCFSVVDETEDTFLKSDTIVSIYYSSFTKNGDPNAINGGAIYISLPKNSNIDSSVPLKIYYSSFVDCFAENGCGIYAESSQSSRLFDIHRCSFIVSSSYINEVQSGCGAYVKSSASTFKFSRCNFQYNKADNGGGIYYTSEGTSSSENLLETEEDETKYGLKVIDCVFQSNKAFNLGGAICIIDNVESKLIEINSCIFLTNTNTQPKDNELEYGGAIYYSFSKSSQASDSTSGDDNRLFHVFNSIFEENKATDYGGSIYISVEGNDLSKTIEISNCSFKQNKAVIGSSSQTSNPTGYGGSIYFSDSSSSSSSSTQSILKIAKCEFTESFAYAKGSSLYLSVNSDSNKVIDINDCTFDKYSSGNSDFNNNKDNAYIESGSKNVQFNINNCDFKGHPIYFNALSTKIENSRFEDYDDGKSSIRYLSNYNDPTTECSLTINKCNFTQSENENIKNNVVSSVYFETPLSSKFTFTNNIIKFSNENSHVLDRGEIEVKSNDYWNFDHNEIEPNEYKTIKTEKADDIPATCGTEFLCPVESSSEESPVDSSSSEEPPVESSSQEKPPPDSSSVEQPPSESSSQEEDSSSESEEPSSSDGNCLDNNPCNMTGTDSGDNYIELEEKNYDLMPDDTRYGRAIRLINYGLSCINSNFTSCKVSEGGGGIFIVLKKDLSKPIYFENLTFKSCGASFGGAAYIYCNSESTKTEIITCTFEENTASRKANEGQHKHLFGGAGLYLQILNSNISGCSFRKNHGSGVKIYNDFTLEPPDPTAPRSSSLILSDENQQQKQKDFSNSMISITGCFFEADKESPSSSSIFYVRGKGINEVPVEVNGCIFTGELSSDSFHIDGDLVKSKNKVTKNDKNVVEKSKLRIESCMFSSSEEKALNKKKNDWLAASFDSNSQIFNYNKFNNNAKQQEEVVPKVLKVEKSDASSSTKTERNDMNYNKRFEMAKMAVTVLSVVAVIAVLFVVTVLKKKEFGKDDNVDNESGIIDIELNESQL